MEKRTIVVAHFVSTLSKTSGVLSVIMNYFRHIDRERFRFDFLYFGNAGGEPYHDEIRRLGGRCVRIAPPSLSPAATKRVEELFRQSEYSILHIHDSYLTFWLAPIAKRAGVPAVVAHAHTTKFSDVPWKAVRNKILSLPTPYLADYACACSNAAAKAYFGKRVMESERYFLVRNAIDPAVYSFNAEDRTRYRREFGFTESDIVIGNVGRFVPQKNQEFLLKAFSVLREQEKKLKLLIIGEGPLRDRLESVRESLRLTGSVLFAGKRMDAARIYNAFDAFCLPSLFEGLPNVLIEAQCNGLPCFASDAITPEAFILDTCGPVDIRKGAAYCAEQMKPYLHKLSRDEKAVSKIAKAGYDIGVESGRLAEFYGRVLDAKGRR